MLKYILLFIMMFSQVLATPGSPSATAGAPLSPTNANRANLNNPIGVLGTFYGGTGSTTANTSLRQLAGQPGVQLVGTRTGVAGIGGNWACCGLQQKTSHILPAGALDIAACYAGWYTGYNGTLSYESAMPYSAGSVFQATSAVVATGGTSYAVGDTIVPTVASNQIAPTLVVNAVSGGNPTSLGVVDGGMFNAVPATGLTQASTSGSGTGATFNLGVVPYPMGLHIGLEQVFGTQTAASSTNTTGVVPFRQGADFKGSQYNVFVPSGQVVCTDFIPVSLAAQSNIGIRLWSNGGNWWTGGVFLNQGTVDAFNYANYTDISKGGTFSSANGSYMLRPLALIGHVATPTSTFVGIGDSIMYGAINSISNVDSGDSYGNMGWFERAVAQNYPWSNFSTDGDQLYYWVDGASKRMQLDAIRMLHPSHIVLGLGINDFSARGSSYATFKTQMQYMTKLLKGMIPGVKIWATTITPYVTCSPDCTTQANQTVSASNTARQLWNADMRNPTTYKSYGIDAVQDIASFVETGGATSPTGKWVTSPNPVTTDGLHPNLAGYTLLDNSFSPNFNVVPLP